ncbi:MAG: Dabb family protein [Cytophagales bacterium]|nr:Dabb family protein [Bernardetiaceae bacterium]MDW8205510.1 Dabb family protein [Cytophagales bacterium]
MKVRFTFIFCTFVGLLLFLQVAKISFAFSPPPAKGKFLHVVYVWLKPDLTAQEIRAFESGMQALKKIKTVKSLHIGKPAGTQREVVDNSYSYVIVIYFNNAQGHDAYQTDPIHQQFVEKHRAKWTRVQVYDALLE